MLNSLRTGLNLHRLILLLAFSATLITFLNSYYSSYQVQKQQLINETLNNHKAYAAKLVSATDNFLLAAQQQLAYVGKILETDFNNQELINAETERLRLQTNSFNSTIIVNKKGNILGVSPASLNLQNLKVDSFGTKAALSYRRPMISEPYISMAGNLLIFMSQPLFDKTGEFIGYVGGTLYLKRASILNELLQVHYYQDGSYLYVVDLFSSLFHKDHLFHSMIITCCDHVNIHTTGYGFTGQVGTIPDYCMVTCVPDFIHQFGNLLSHDVIHRNCHKGLLR